MPDHDGEMLVVDLDGTLLRSDMLYESFWSSFGRDWRTPMIAAGALRSGRAVLKDRLAGSAKIDIASLPYDSQVLDYVRSWREAGGRTALVTASDQRFAQSIADHLGVFDEAHGSDGTRNLKGEQKARFLDDRFGVNGFAYMGDSLADLAIWKDAAKAITVNAPLALQRKAEFVAPLVEHLSTAPPSIRPYIKAMRPHQWIKNVLVFLPMLAAHQFDGQTLLRSTTAFIAFCLIASSVYVLNDLLDLAADRAHPRKRNRPFASGQVPIAHGTWMAAGLILLGGAVALGLGGTFFLVMVGYFLLTTAYSLDIKRRSVIDICVLAGLYTARIVAGGVAADIPLSVWLLAFSIFFFLSLAAVKRQAELVDSAGRGELQASGRGYQVEDLPIMSMIAIASGYVSVLVMALYVNAPGVVELYPFPEALWGVCAVLLYWITRTVMLTHRGHMNDDPVVYAARDRISQLSFLVILAFVVVGSLL